MKDVNLPSNDIDADDLKASSSNKSEVIFGNVQKKSFFKNKKVLGICLLVIGLLGLSYLGFLNFYKTAEKQGFKDIVIGDTTITKADIDRYARSVENYKKDNPDLKFNQSASEIAIDDLVMNAALVKEAKERNKSLTEAELRKIYKIPKTTTDYQATIKSWKSYDGSGYFVYTVEENLQLRKKLTEDILAKKSIFLTAVNFDAPFFRLEKNDNKLQGYHEQAKERLTKELLPLFQKKLNKSEIAKKADVNYADNQKEPNDIYKLFMKKIVTTAGYMEQYSSSYVSNPKFNDMKTIEESGKLNESFYDLEDVDYGILINDLKNTNQEIDKLKNVGDYTGVFASKTGRYMIARLEKKSGGDYANWEEFLNKYKEQSIPKENKISKSSQSNAKKSSNLLSQLVTPQTVKAQSGPADGCGNHRITASIALVFPNGASAQALVAISQAANVCLPGGASAWGDGYASISGTCWGSPPTSSYTLPSGYRVTADLTSTWSPSDTNAYHVWQRMVYLTRDYNPPPPNPPPNNNPGNPGGNPGNNPVEPTCSVSASLSQDPNTLQYNVTISWSSSHNQSQSLSWSGSGQSGVTVEQNVTSFPRTYTGTFTNGNFDPPRSVTCSDTVNLTGPPPPELPTSPMLQPYMRVYGNDVIVGSVFKNDAGECETTSTSEPITGITKSKIVDDKRVYAGASGQFAVFDNSKDEYWKPPYGDIKQFFSDNQRSQASVDRTELGGLTMPGNTIPPNDLTFGNHYSVYTPNKSGSDKVDDVNYPGWWKQKSGRVPAWGGNSGLVMCIPNYYGDTEAAGVKSVPGGILSDIARTLTLPIEDTERKLLLVNGDLFIDKNVKYKNTSWDSVSDIPNVTVIVKGNIRIDKDVTQLDGIYVAQPKNSASGNNPDDGGLIYTCSQIYRPYLIRDLRANCGKQLVINGSFISKKVIFHRTKGSVVCDERLPATVPCTPAEPNESADSDNIAEVFNFSPEAYLTPLSSKLETSAPYQKYDYITSLPPVL